MSEKKEPNLEWYVLNEDWTRNEKFDCFPYSEGKVKPWNIFNNICVYEDTIKLCKDYKRKKMSLDSFIEELRKIIQCEEWSRSEYEIYVETHFSEKSQKIDCYQQVLPNIRILAEYVLRTYYPRTKIDYGKTDSETQ